MIEKIREFKSKVERVKNEDDYSVVIKRAICQVLIMANLAEMHILSGVPIDDWDKHYFERQTTFAKYFNNNGLDFITYGYNEITEYVKQNYWITEHAHQDRVRNLASLMIWIRQRPAMYLGDKKVTTLSHFLGGFKTAANIYDVPDDVGKNFGEFHGFVERRFKIDSTIGWPRILLKECNGDEEKALELFFKCFDDFMAQQ